MHVFTSRSTRVGLAGLALAGLAGVSACAPAAPAGPQTSLTVAATAEPATLDMTAQAAVAPAQVQLYNVYETLVKIDDAGQLQPLLASSWDVSPDRLTYTFKLNPAAKFASGKAVDAAAVVANIERIRTTATLPKKHKDTGALISAVKATDATTVQVTLKRASNTWLFAMAGTTGMVADPEGFATMAEKSAGSGPYAVKEWRRGDAITLARNEAYWGAKAPFESVSFKYFADPNAMNAAMLAGTVDVISNEQAPDALAQFSDTSRFAVVDGGTNAEVVLGLNNGTEALKDVRVRKAIAMAIDKKKLVANVSAGHGTVLGSMVVPTDPYYEDLSAVNGYDPAQSKALLAQAGKASGLTLRLRPAALPYATASAQQVAADLNAVGVKTTIEEQQFPTKWIDTVYTKADYDLTIVAHVEPRDLANYNSADYYWRYNNPAFKAAWTAADEAAPDQYVPEMKKAAKILADDAASVWLYMLPNLVVSKANVEGLPKNSTTDSFDLTGVKTR